MPNSYSGVWHFGSGPYYLWANVGWESFKSKWQELSAQNMRLVDMEVHPVGNEVHYPAVGRRSWRLPMKSVTI